MFLIIFLWTPPHFWALALLRADDYARAGVPMLPVVAGRDETRRQILIYSLVARAGRRLRRRCSALPGSLYGAVALVCGAVMLRAGLARLSRPHRAGGRHRPRSKLFAFSLLYVFVLFAALLVDNVLARLGLALMSDEPDDGIVLTEEQKRRRRARSIAIALSLGVLVVLFYVVTLVKGPAVLIRPL